MYQKQKFQYQLTKKDKRWHSWVLFFLRAKCFHLLKMKAVTCHKTLCAQAPRCQQHLTAPPSWAENLGNLDECSLSSWRTFFSFCHFAAEFAHYTAQCWFLRLCIRDIEFFMKTMKSEDKNTKVHPAENLIKNEWAELGTERRKSCSWTSRLWGLFSISLSQQQSQGRGGSSNPQKGALTERTPRPTGLNCWL